MNFKAILNLISYTVMVIGLGMGIACGVSVYFDDPVRAQQALGVSGAVALFAGIAMRVATRGEIELTRRDGFAIVTLGWVFAAVFGALPYILSGVIRHPVSAVFETMSGLTTTGASVLADVESLPRGILFWRAMTHLFGGMGVLVLCVAILPFLGVGGMQIYQAEMPGPGKDRLTPRIETTARFLWGVYLLLGLAEAVLLRVGGMTWFDSVCHTFATIATGGFSTRNASVGAYNSVFIESVIIVFMFLAGANFALHFRALRGRPASYFRDPEFRFYLGTWLGACLFVSALVWRQAHGGILHSLRAGFFQATSIMTTTGFATCDFDRWTAGARMILLLLMFVGGCAGSTGGGIKVVRIFVALKAIGREIRLFIQPQAVLQVKFGEQRLDQDIVSNIVAFIMIFVALFAAGTLIMCAFMPDLMSAASSVAATLGNIGPGFGLVGPASTYAGVPTPGQALLTLFMLLGRLELYTVLVLFFPSFWKK